MPPVHSQLFAGRRCPLSRTSWLAQMAPPAAAGRTHLLACFGRRPTGRPAAPAPSGLHPASGAAGWRLGV